MLFFEASHSGSGASGSLLRIARGISGCEIPRPGIVGLMGLSGSVPCASLLLSAISPEFAEIVISCERVLKTDSLRSFFTSGA